MEAVGKWSGNAQALQREYERMESALRDMEGRLRMKEVALSSMDEDIDAVEPLSATDGSFMFRFGGAEDRCCKFKLA